ncbi:hypothetical protein [Stratiformator vulcanicus]|uniref:Cytochrome c-552/4 domain-containing protein n=1 Tax=Stratiformator vulcanicus TaxID=2527980 RepID=A0A517QX68_9PLAN|nr:hypothetical protein [Stratiformator vulcanicus]QDT36183.1 hypothetical protein Pan189_05380 [Stratiformator vulcanicus]
MKSYSSRFSCCTALFVTLTCCGIAPAQEAQESDPAPTRYGTGGKFEAEWYHDAIKGRQVVGYGLCARCHSQLPVPTKSVGPAPPGASLLVNQTGGWIQGNSQAIWVQLDKHAKASLALKSERSQTMARRMGVVDENGASLIHRDQRCLACHASFPVSQLTLDQQAAERSDACRFVIEDFGTVEEGSVKAALFGMGVSCEGCHGPSSPAEGSTASSWYQPHLDPKWRNLSSEEKLSKYGYWDVRDRKMQARICLSCHVGNVRQGKIVTHEMYAAGHPPLPGFELRTFINQEPRHWKEMEEKPADVRDDYLKKLNLTFDVNQKHQTRQMLIGAVMSLRETVGLAADICDPSVSSPLEKPSAEWPELSSFNCYACHHELYQPSWRQERPQPAGAGRPTLHEWPNALVTVAARLEDRGDEYQSTIQKLYAALARQPFGQPDDMVEAGTAIRAWCDQLAADLEQADMDEAYGQRVMEEICNVGQEQIYDYDGSRQLAWAFAVAYRDWNPNAKKPQVGVPFEWIEDPEGSVEEQLKSMEEVYQFSLLVRVDPTTVTKFEDLYGDTEVQVRDAMLSLANYRPAVVKKSFATLRKRLDEATKRGADPDAVSKRDGPVIRQR